jgi:hypothetical protein
MNFSNFFAPTKTDVHFRGKDKDVSIHLDVTPAKAESIAHVTSMAHLLKGGEDG